MEKIITVGLDLAKSIFQVHGIADDGSIVVRRALRRSQVLDFFRSIDPCCVGIEACASSHYWANAIGQLGHTVRMMPPTYVKAYVKRNKTDAADAEAICEAVSRPTMRFVPIKTPGEQAACMVGPENYSSVSGARRRMRCALIWPNWASSLRRA
jgi:transposase